MHLKVNKSLLFMDIVIRHMTSARSKDTLRVSLARRVSLLIELLQGICLPRDQ